MFAAATGNTFSNLPFSDWEHVVPQPERVSRPDVVLVAAPQHRQPNGDAQSDDAADDAQSDDDADAAADAAEALQCLEPVHGELFGDGAHMMTHYGWQIIYYRALRYWFGTGGGQQPTDGVRLFHAERRVASPHTLLFVVPLYALLAAWLLYCVRARSGVCLCVGVLLALAPVW